LEVNGMTALELQALRTGQGKTQLVDVRSASEYAAGHIPGAMNVPLEQIESRIDDFSADALIVLICQRGPRACMAATFLDGRRQTTVLDGGTRDWCQAGLPLVTGTRTRWAPERQVRLIAGLMVLAGTSLALLVNAHWMFLPGFVGLGLTVAGLTDFCLLGSLLGRMPWNRPGAATKAATAPTCSL
jgi:rhodanese-related sulfurtransferase